MRIRSYIVLLLLLITGISLPAQNLEKIGRKEMVTAGGGMNFNSIFYDANGMPARRDPFTWYFSGNLNFTILDVSLPFTFSYTNNHGTYTQPFNMQSVHPKYKWAQAHLGTTAMNFSQYTLNGIVFTGGGIELTPNGFYLGAMYGRLNKAVAADPAMNSFEGMSYRRNGFAVKAGYDKDGHSITATYFSAKDDAGSLLFVPAAADLSPQQNTAISFAGKLRLLEKITAEAEFAISGLTRNLFSGMETTDFSGLEKWLLPTHTTTQFFKAWKSSLAYSGKSISVSLNHEHVDPDYRTFGAYYFNNDLENWTIAPAFRFFKGKVSVAFSTGIQRNNLDASKLNTMHRWVGSANISANLFSWLATNFSFSNFTSYTNKRPNTDPFWQPSSADTLSFYQVARQANSNLIFSFGSKAVKQNISLSGSWQITQQQQAMNETPATSVLNGNLSWSAQITKLKLSLSVIGNYNRSKTDTMLLQFLGPGLQFNQSVMKGQLRFAAGSIYNRSLSQHELQSHVLSHRAQISFSPRVKNKKYGKPSLSLNGVYVSRFPVNSTQQTTGELTVTANLGYSF